MILYFVNSKKLRALFLILILSNSFSQSSSNIRTERKDEAKSRDNHPTDVTSSNHSNGTKDEKVSEKVKSLKESTSSKSPLRVGSSTHKMELKLMKVEKEEKGQSGSVNVTNSTASTATNGNEETKKTVKTTAASAASTGGESVVHCAVQLSNPFMSNF